MATQAIVHDGVMVEADAASFERLAGYSAIGAGLSGLLYSIAFVVLKEPLLYSIFLMTGGIASSTVMVALYRRLKAVDAGMAQWAMLLGVVAAIGSVIHGGYDLGNSINPPATPNADLPSQVDPRGLLTFGLAGLALFGVSWLMSKGGGFPRSLAYLGYALAALLVVVYLGRLIILSPTNLGILVPAAITGFIVSPAWNILVGINLLRARKSNS
jgi:hypothetical protein